MIPYLPNLVPLSQCLFPSLSLCVSVCVTSDRCAGVREEPHQLHLISSQDLSTNIRLSQYHSARSWLLYQSVYASSHFSYITSFPVASFFHGLTLSPVSLHSHLLWFQPLTSSHQPGFPALGSHPSQFPAQVIVPGSQISTQASVPGL